MGDIVDEKRILIRDDMAGDAVGQRISSDFGQIGGASFIRREVPPERLRSIFFATADCQKAKSTCCAMGAALGKGRAKEDLTGVDPRLQPVSGRIVPI